MKRKIEIDPATRLAGEGKVVILLDESGGVERAFFQSTDLRGFEKFCEGRAAEDLPMLTAKICGVCPTAHHLAASKALDDLFQVTPPPAARKIRELMLTAFIYEDHLLHFYYLGGADFLLGPETSPPERNLFGVLKRLGREAGERILRVRREVRNLNARLGGSPLFPVTGLPGGLSISLQEADRAEALRVSALALELALESMALFRKRLAEDAGMLEWFRGPDYTQTTYYLGLVDEQGRVNFYDGHLRVVDPDGREFRSFLPRHYNDHLAVRMEPWTYSRIPYLKEVGWRGWRDGRDNGVYRVAPLGRLNAATGMATPLAQEECQRMMAAFGGRPVHQTLAYHWARLVEVVYAAERMQELAADPELTDPRVRNLPEGEPREGIGVVEAARGTLIHHYRTDGRGIVLRAELLVATQNNMAALCLAVDQAARGTIRAGKITEALLNRIETAYRAYDPCLACSTHILQGRPNLTVVRRGDRSGA